VTKRSLVAWSLRTVLPLKTVRGSEPVLVIATWATWSTAPTISTDRGHETAMAVPARATIGRMLEIILRTCRL